MTVNGNSYLLGISTNSMEDRMDEVTRQKIVVEELEVVLHPVPATSIPIHE